MLVFKQYKSTFTTLHHYIFTIDLTKINHNYRPSGVYSEMFKSEWLGNKFDWPLPACSCRILLTLFADLSRVERDSRNNFISFHFLIVSSVKLCWFSLFRMRAFDEKFKNAGKKAGELEIWRINKFDLEPLPKEQFGNFCSGDCYIVLKTKGSDNWDIHFWLGWVEIDL